jgi:hypothetical protein
LPPGNEEAQQGVRGQPPISFSVSAQSLFNGGGASTSTLDEILRE